MKRRFFISFLSTVVIPASIVCAASSVSTHSSKAMAAPAASAAEQLAQASRLERQMAQTPLPQKIDLFAQAWANLAIVCKAWPNDKGSCVRSGVMQADLATEFGLWPKAVDALLDILPLAVKTDTEPQVEEKLGQAYEQTGNPAEAEKHLLAAERAMHRTHPNRVESEGILSMLGMFYSRQKKPLEAIQRFREAQNLPGQDLVNEIGFQLSVVGQAVQLGRNVAAPEFARFDDLVSAAQRTTLSPADATLIRDMTKHVQRIRDKSHQ